MKKQNTITNVLLLLILVGIIYTGWNLKQLNERQETMENNLKAYFQTME